MYLYIYNIGDWIINQLVTSGATLYNNNNEFDNLVGNYDNWGNITWVFTSL